MLDDKDDFGYSRECHVCGWRGMSSELVREVIETELYTESRIGCPKCGSPVKFKLRLAW